MPRTLWRLTFLALVLLSACKTRPAKTVQHAMVLLRDGTRVSGSVVSSSASYIQVMGADQVTRSVPMSLIRSIDYRETALASTPATRARRSERALGLGQAPPRRF